MSELRELYQEVILDHSKNPRNATFPDDANRENDGYNPLCGDRLTLKLTVDRDRIVGIGFQGSGCAISQAAASTMTEAVKGKTMTEVRDLFDRFHAVVTGTESNPDLEELGKLAVFAGVAEFPMRVKCATLSWHTLLAALDGGDDHASTE